MLTVIETPSFQLIAVYVKAKFDNLPAQVLKSWKEAYDEQS